MDDVLDYLEGRDNPERTYTIASKGKRFGNYIIDLIGYLIFSSIIGIIIGVLAVAYGNEDFLEEETISAEAKILEWLTGLVVITAYYTFQEYLFKGKTLGKLLTKTRAVTIDNRRIDLNTSIKRNLIRLVPFEIFSFLGEDSKGWHDSWSQTKVIEDNDWRDIGDYE
ncbi:RDD family protein [Flexithrix dorotheae]|uniref:RDD family protein n=1 Tax=Flexithrix dorotheae TaxID=70993 RepID=UPI000374D9C1|nr:RDD family protein [Flexithrix dorotheae]